jgi:hypothetical protein
VSPLRCEISFDKKIQGPGHVLSHVEKHEMARPQLGSANFKILFLFLVFCIILFFLWRGTWISEGSNEILCQLLKLLNMEACIFESLGRSEEEARRTTERGQLDRKALHRTPKSVGRRQCSGCEHAFHADQFTTWLRATQRRASNLLLTFSHGAAYAKLESQDLRVGDAICHGCG